MAQTKKQKVAIVAKLEDAFKNAATTVVLHFKGVKIDEETEMRKSLRAAGVTYTVAKKTLIKRALESLGHKTDEASLPGEVALAYGGNDDVTAPARLIHEFGKKYQTTDKKSKLRILGGIFEGKFIDSAMMQEIATIPSAKTLRGMFANVINSPRSRFAIVLSEVAKKKN